MEVREFVGSQAGWSASKEGSRGSPGWAEDEEEGKQARTMQQLETSGGIRVSGNSIYGPHQLRDKPSVKRGM